MFPVKSFWINGTWNKFFSFKYDLYMLGSPGSLEPTTAIHAFISVVNNKAKLETSNKSNTSGVLLYFP